MVLTYIYKAVESRSAASSIMHGAAEVSVVQGLLRINNLFFANVSSVDEVARRANSGENDCRLPLSIIVLHIG